MKKQLWVVLCFALVLLALPNDPDANAMAWEERKDIPVNKEWKITLSGTADPNAPFERYIKIFKGEEQVPAAVRLGKTDREIIVSPPAGGYLPATQYELVIQKGLPSASGQLLKEDVTLPLQTGKELAPHAFEVREDSKNEITLKDEVIELSEEDVQNLLVDAQRLVLHKNEEERTVLSASLKVGQILTIPASYHYPFGHAIKVTKVIYDANGQLTALEYKDADLTEVIDNIDISTVTEDIDINPAFIRFPNAADRDVNGLDLDLQTPEFTITPLKDKKGFSFELGELGLFVGADGKDMPYIDNGDYDKKLALTVGGKIEVTNIDPKIDMGVGLVPLRPVIKEQYLSADLFYDLDVNVIGTLGFGIEPVLVEVPIPYTGVKIGKGNLKAGLMFQIYLKLAMDANGQLGYTIASKYTMETTAKKKPWSYAYDTNAILTPPDKTENISGSIQTHAEIGLGAGIPIMVGAAKIMNTQVEGILAGDIEAGMLHWKEACARFDASFTVNASWSIAMLDDLMALNFPIAGAGYSSCKEDPPSFDYTKREGTQKFTLPTNMETFDYVVAANQDDLLNIEVKDAPHAYDYELYKWNKQKQAWAFVSKGQVSKAATLVIEEKNGYKIVLSSKKVSKASQTFSYKLTNQSELDENSVIPIDEQLTLTPGEAQNYDFWLTNKQAMQTIVSSNENVYVYWQYFDAEKSEWKTLDVRAQKNLNRSQQTEGTGRYRVQLLNQGKTDITATFKAKALQGDANERDSLTTPRTLDQAGGTATFTLHANEDEDFFAIHLKAGEALQVRTTNAQGLLATLHYENNATGRWEQIESIGSTSGDINRSFLAEKTGRYVLKMENYGDYSLNEIQLHYRILAGDAGELDSFAKPRTLNQAGGTESFTLHAHRDKDYFAIDLKAGEALQAITMNANGMMAKLYYENSTTGNWVYVDGAGSTSSNINQSLLAEKTGRYIIELESYYSGYSLDEIQFKYKILSGDAGELDSFAKPRTLNQAGGTESFTLHANRDKDYFAIDLKAGEALQMATMGDARILARLYYEDSMTGKLTHVESASSSSANINHSMLAEKAGRYIIELESYFSGYSLDEIQFKYKILSGDAGELDSFAKPRILNQAGGTESFTLHANRDKDYFAIDLKAGEALQITTAHVSGITARLYVENNATGKWEHVTTAQGSSGTVKKELAASKTGRYVLEIESYFSGYSLDAIQLQYKIVQP